MLARTGRGIPVDLAEWAIEPKWDGWRCLARIDNGTLRLTSRWRNGPARSSERP
jgi:ATP-dependent DNA ligase